MQEHPTQSTVEKPERGELDPAALALLERHGTQIMLAARRHAATLEDAEDAFQRAFEIMLAKAPTTNEKDLVPWLKTVVKHEAFALRHHQERHAPITVDGELLDRPAPTGSTHEQAERRERMAHTAEALGRLKPREVRAMVLRAEGYSYREICERTGWTHTMLNRALVEGRRAFRARLAGIETGVECTRLEPLLSRLADHEADADDLAQLRPHMKTCLTCRKRLKEFRAAPGHVAALAPTLAAQSDGGGALRGFAESVVGAVQHKVAALGERAHAAAELVTGQKVAAVAASAAALAGGGTAVDRIASAPDPPRVPAGQVEQTAAPVEPETTIQAPPPAPDASSTPAPQAQPADPPPAAAPEPQPANEFDPAAAAAAAQSTSTAAPAPPRPQPSQSTTGTGIPSGGGGESNVGGSGSGSGEFTP